ncbi:MAG TPA: isopentenyl phosphate kinase [Anaerolineaceae bacterium]
MDSDRNIQLIKLGGSLITEKNTPRQPRREVIARLAQEIKSAWKQAYPLPLVIGHGSGSFGHIPAKKYQTRQGVHSPSDWLGFVEVWQEARSLNQIVLNIFLDASIPVVSFPISASAISEHGVIKFWNLEPLKSALNAGLIPLVYGDVIFDKTQGGSIVSTEEIFLYLSHHLPVSRILIAGIEQGVWSDFPKCQVVQPLITPRNISAIHPALFGSTSTDVTGGMVKKVNLMLEIIKENPAIEAVIYSGMIPDLTTQVLQGQPAGTLIRYCE